MRARGGLAAARWTAAFFASFCLFAYFRAYFCLFGLIFA
jgi:hypothetical protein